MQSRFALASLLIRTSGAARNPLAVRTCSTFSTLAAPVSSAQAASWMTQAAQGNYKAMIGPFKSHKRFDSFLEGMTITEVTSDGFVKAELPLSSALSNSYDTLHGGVHATIVDVLGSMSILAKDKSRAGVSVDINCSYLRATKLDDTLIIESKCLKSGKQLAFATVDIRRKSDGELVATGRHTKALAAL